MIKECENCGQKHENAFVILKDGREHTFDNFECAINFIAPRCFHCNQLIIGKQINHEGEIFCSAECSYERHFSPVMA